MEIRSDSYGEGWEAGFQAGVAWERKNILELLFVRTDKHPVGQPDQKGR